MNKLGWRLDEIAKALGVSRQFVQREEKAGNLKAKRIAGTVIVLTKDLEAWLEGPDRLDDERRELGKRGRPRKAAAAESPTAESGDEREPLKISKGKIIDLAFNIFEKLNEEKPEDENSMAEAEITAWLKIHFPGITISDEYS